MSVVVTGCAGFIGAVVCAKLLTRGERVFGIDEMNDAYDPRLKEWRLRSLLNSESFTFHRVDIAEKEELFRMLEGTDEAGGISAVINLAARAGVRQSVENPGVYFRANVTGCLNLLEWTCSKGIKRFIQASSSSVYGAGVEQPFREEDPTDRPLSPYAASKKSSEVLCHCFHHLYGLNIAVLRFFTVFGPAGRPDMSIFRFIKWIAEGEEVVLYGDGEQSRDFTYVDDIAEGVVGALGINGYEVINLGGDNPYTVNRIIDMIAKVLNKDYKLKRERPNPLDVKATWADISKARALIGWEPETEMEKGLERTAQWYLDNRDWATFIDIGD